MSSRSVPRLMDDPAQRWVQRFHFGCSSHCSCSLSPGGARNGASVVVLLMVPVVMAQVVLVKVVMAQLVLVNMLMLAVMVTVVLMVMVQVVLVVLIKVLVMMVQVVLVMLVWWPWQWWPQRPGCPGSRVSPLGSHGHLPDCCECGWPGTTASLGSSHWHRWGGDPGRGPLRPAGCFPLSVKGRPWASPGRCPPGRQ